MADKDLVIIKKGSKEGNTAVAQTDNPTLTEFIYCLGFINNKTVINIKKDAKQFIV